MNEQFPPSQKLGPIKNQQPPESLSGQQMQALAKNHADHLAAIKRDVELRKWAVDQACGLAGTSLEFNTADANGGTIDPVKLARQIHAFLVEGAEKAI